jgi:hypothetical protein
MIRMDDLTSPSPIIEIMFRANFVYNILVSNITISRCDVAHLLKEDQTGIVHYGLSVRVQRLMLPQIAMDRG